MAASVAVLLATANPLLGALPVLLVVAAYAVLTLPARIPLFAGLALVILADIAPSRLPDDVDFWHSPVYPLQLLLTENLNKLIGVEAVRISGFELLALVLIALVAVRAFAGDRTDAAGRIAPARPLVLALVLNLGAVLAMELWGVARGGDVRQSLWQFRQLLWMPVLALLFCATMRGARDAAVFAGLAATTSCAKIVIGAYYYLAIARPLGVVPATVTSHADSVLFVVSLAVWLGAAYYRPSVRLIALASALAGWTLFGLVINNRRTAYLTLLAAAAMFYATLPRRARRAVTLAGLAALPVLSLYVAVGRNRTGSVFVPAAKLMSVVTQKDASSLTRDIENFNLITTLHGNPLVGSGWGHEYVEVVHAYDISKVFPQYRYVAHNSVLWMWSIGGLVGFTLLWLPIAMGVFLAARARMFATTPLDRAVAYGALATFVAFVIQAWADMGTQSWTTQGMLAVALAASGQLAVGTGAWPQRTRLFGASAPRSGARA
ncbi:MAG TPA: O-antigen ligase family protein [Gemmatirosa sp.]